MRSVNGVREVPHENPGTVELVGRAAEQLRRLAHDEVQLAVLDMTKRGRRAGVGGAAMTTAAALGALAAMCAVAAAVIGLAQVTRPWAAALWVALALVVLAGLIGLPGLLLVKRSTPPIPRDAVESVRDDITAVRVAASHTSTPNGSRS